MRRVSLRLKFLLLLFLLLAVVFVVVTAIIVRKESRTLRQNLVNNSKSFAALATPSLGGSYEQYQNSGIIQVELEAEKLASLEPDINQIEILDTSNKTLFIQNRSSPVFINSNINNSLTPTYINDSKGRLLAVVQPYIENYGIHKYNMVYGVSYASVDRSIHSVIISISLISLIFLLFSLIIAYWLINKLFLEPVVDVSRLALSISKGNLDKQIKLLRDDEIGDLAIAVRTMANSLKQDIIKLKQEEIMKNEFMMITSHNLRTPLAILEGYVDMIKKRADADLMKLLEPLIVNINRLRGFAEDILTASTFEAGDVKLDLKAVEMRPLLLSLADQYALLAKQKHIYFDVDIKTRCQVSLSQMHFRSALLNLLDNAYKFTPEGGKVFLQAADDGRQLHIRIVDNGIGISTSELPMLFTKFHRSTSTLKYNYEGSGIGLYLSKLIIEKHSGSISVESTLEKGSVFTITLPVLGAR